MQPVETRFFKLFLYGFLEKTFQAYLNNSMKAENRINRPTSPPKIAATVTMNEALGTSMDERTQKLIRRKGWYVSTDEIKQR